VAPPFCPAHQAFSTGNIDLSYYTVTVKKAFFIHDLSHKFMTRDTLKSHITFNDFKISVADGRVQDFYEGFTFAGNRIRYSCQVQG
jgi:hypothetical protein